MRSLLFVPGDDARKLEKACGLETDALIIDLEDSVSLSNKQKARRRAADFLTANREGAAKSTRPELYVRINALDTDLWQDDVDGIVPAEPDGLMLPKARSGADVDALARRLDKVDPAGGVKLIVLVTEVPEALLRMASFLDCDRKRLQALTWGGEDLSAELGAAVNRDEAGVYTAPYQLARSLCLVTAAAAGCAALDSVYTDFRDLEGLRREALAAKRDGFSGKLAIHPGQLAVINEVFTPGDDEISRAKAVVAAFEAQPDAGVVALDGQMLDRPHLSRAGRILAAARNQPRTRYAGND